MFIDHMTTVDLPYSHPSL